MSFIQNPEEVLKSEGKSMCTFCKECMRTRVARTNGPIGNDGKPLYEKGEFIIPCSGIPEDNKFLPQHDRVIAKLSIEEPLTEEQYEDLLSVYDPITWARKYLQWEPRSSVSGEEYQQNILRCSSKRKVLRCGRRLGKSEVLIVDALFKLYNFSPKQKRYDKHTKKWEKGRSTILFVAPYLSQVKDFFSRLRDFIGNNPELAQEVKSDVSTPFYKLELKSGMKILGFSAGSSGAKSIRGQKADWIILDEMDYLDQESIDTLVALLMEHNDVELLAASTPSGRREYFFEFCQERMDFKEFYYSSMCNPSWGPRMELELRGMYRTEIAWAHEILAEFGEASTSVFQFKYIECALSNYRYVDAVRRKDCFYVMGVDWNDAANGTKIRITEWSPLNGTISAVAHSTVQKAGWTQTMAIEEMIRLNRIWNCDHIYVDEGYGSTQIEVLRQIGQAAQTRKDAYAHADMAFLNTKGINFSSKIEIYDPISGLPKKQMMKPYIVESSVRFFERGYIRFPMEDEMLMKQLHGYQILKVNASGVPVYEAGPSGDHDLDAFMLTLLGIEIEYGPYSKQTFSGSIAFSGRLGEGSSIAQPSGVTPEEIVKHASRPQTPEVRQLSIPTIQPVGFMFTNSGQRVYSREAFNNDDRRSTSRQSLLNNRQQGFRGSRRLF